MKRTLKIIFLTVPTSIVACNVQSATSSEQSTNEATTAADEIGSNISDVHLNKKIVLYMKGHDLLGIERSSKSDADYYRVLIKVLPKNKYLVQDFFVSGKKFTDPYILTGDSIEYTDNEDVAHPSNYYLREGSRVVWSESGGKKIESHYKNNMPTDTWTEYFENGRKQIEDHYEDGVLHGVSKIWNEQGDLIGECNYKQGVQDGRCYVKYSANPDIYIYDINYKNGKKIGISKKWNIDGSIEYFTFNGLLSLQDIEKDLKDSSFKIFKFDITADEIDDLVISRVNGDRNLYQGDELYVLKGNSKGKYKSTLSTSNHTDEAGWFLSDILPKANNSGFILQIYFATRGNSNQTFYFDKMNDEFVLTKYVSDGTLISGEDYYCVEKNTFASSDFEYGKSSNYSDKQFKEYCSPPSTTYQVIVDKAEILNENFEPHSPLNYYIKGDSFGAFDQNEDWVQVSYKNGAKFGWIDKRDLKPVSD